MEQDKNLEKSLEKNLEKTLVEIKERIINFYEESEEDDVLPLECMELIEWIDNTIDNLNLDYRKLYIKKIDKMGDNDTIDTTF